MNTDRPRNPASSQSAFTLVEILIVLAIIGLIAGLTIGNLGNMFGGAETDAEQTKVNSAFDAPILQFKLHTGGYPSTAEGLKALVAASGKKASKWKGPYVTGEEALDDHWGNPYQYRFPATKSDKPYDIWSFGPDGVESADDIGNW